MTPAYVLFAVEGPTDQAVLGRILKLLKYKRFPDLDSAQQLDPFWRPFLMTYPRGGNLYRRMSFPPIFLSPDSDVSVAIYGGEGSNMGKDLSATLKNQPALHSGLTALAIFVDADKHPADKAAADYQAKLKDHYPAFPINPGVVVPGPPRLGTFVVPNNKDGGVIEHIALECGAVSYPTLLREAGTFVASFDADARKRAGWGPFDEQKAIIAAVASLLKPGKTNAVTLQDNDWLAEPTLDRPLLSQLVRFCKDMLAPPQPPASYTLAEKG